MSQEDWDSLQRQLKEARENLRIVQERKATFVPSNEAPLQLDKEEHRLLERIAELEQQLADQPGKIRSRNLTRIAGAFVIVAAVAALAGYVGYLAGVNTVSGVNDNVLSLESLPFVAFAWSTATVPSETGWATLNVINDAKSQKTYYFEYTLPMTSTDYSGAGLTFKFNEPQDFGGYSRVSITISFESPDTRCDFIMWDVSDKSKSVALSPNITLNQDIERRRSGLTESFTIPLDTYFGNVSRKDVREIAFATDASISPGHHSVTIANVVFSK